MGFFQSSGILNRRGFFGGAAAFSPKDISGLELWLDATTGLFDATSGGSAVTTDGSAVARWEDQSGNGRHFKQSTANNQPILKTSIQNSKNIIRFDGANDFMEMDSAFSGLTSASYYVVLKIANDPPSVQSRAGHPIFFLYSTAGGGKASHFPWTDSIIYDATMSSTRRTVGNPSQSLANYNLYNVDADASSWTARLNKTQLFNATSNTFEQREKIIGRSVDVNNFYYYDGDLAEIIAYNTVLSSTNRSKVEDYLYSKWAIA
jgi:hypothetical protein